MKTSVGDIIEVGTEIFTDDVYYKALLAERLFQQELSNGENLPDAISNTMMGLDLLIESGKAAMDNLAQEIQKEGNSKDMQLIHNQLRSIANQVIVSAWKSELDEMIETKEVPKLRPGVQPEAFLLKAEAIVLTTRQDILSSEESTSIDQKYAFIINAMRKQATPGQTLSLSDQYLIEAAGNKTPVFIHNDNKITERDLLEAYIYLEKPENSAYKKSYEVVLSAAAQASSLKAFIAQSLHAASITRNDSIEMLYSGITDAIIKDPSKRTPYQTEILKELPEEMQNTFQDRRNLAMEISSKPKNKEELKVRLNGLNEKLHKQYQTIFKASNAALQISIHNSKSSVIKTEFNTAQRSLQTAKKAYTSAQQDLLQLSMRERKLGARLAFVGIAIIALAMSITIAPYIGGTIAAFGALLAATGFNMASKDAPTFDATTEYPALERITNSAEAKSSETITHTPPDHATKLQEGNNGVEKTEDLEREYSPSNHH